MALAKSGFLVWVLFGVIGLLITHPPLIFLLVCLFAAYLCLYLAFRAARHVFITVFLSDEKD